MIVHRPTHKITHGVIKPKDGEPRLVPKVNSSDEKEVGHVAELVGDRGTREVTHFVVEHGNMEVTLPLTAIDFVAENTVNLKLDKASMEKLPWIEARPKHGAWAGANMELVGAVSDDTNGVQQTLEFIRDLHHRDVLKIKHAPCWSRTRTVRSRSTSRAISRRAEGQRPGRSWAG